MDRLFDVIALGELLIDFTESGQSAQGNPLYEANPGGAPANVLAMLAKLGRSCAFIGKVGRDRFGDLLEETVRQAGINTDGLAREDAVPTTLAVVSTGPDGDRSFCFYRSPGADLCLRSEELDMDHIRRSRIFHFGSLSLTDEPCRSATLAAVAAAKEGGALISFDPNLREPLWADLADAKEQIAWGLGQCDILKISENELQFMTGEEDYDRGTAILREQHPNIRLLNVTAGAEGSWSFCGENRVFVPACKLGGVIETTGAGDTFCACVLNFLLDHGLEGLSSRDMESMLAFANAAAYLVTTRKGAIRSMPERQEIEAVLAKMGQQITARKESER